MKNLTDFRKTLETTVDPHLRGTGEDKEASQVNTEL